MLNQLKEQLPSYAKDLKLNLSTVLAVDSESRLQESQILGITLACAYATKNQYLVELLEQEATTVLDEAQRNATRAAASIMAMNNIYYRFVHLVSDKEYQAMPARLRMNVLANPGVDKTDFELFSLAVSAVNGCGMCMDSHVKVLLKQGLSKSTIAHAVRIAAVVNALAQVISIENL